MTVGFSCLHCRYCDKVIGSFCHCQFDHDTPKMESYKRARLCGCYNEKGYIHPHILVYDVNSARAIIQTIYSSSQLSLDL